MWEAASGYLVTRLDHTHEVSDIAFNSDGEYLATSSDDRAAWIWLWRPEDLIIEASARLTQNLTPEE